MPLAHEKQEFSKRLKDSLKRAQVQARGAAAVAREFNLRYDGTPVTAQAARKWLTGAALPSQDKLRALSLWLEVSPHWLRFGDEAGQSKASSVLRQTAATYRVDSGWLAKKYEALNEPHKRMVVELLLALLRLEGKRG
jgi:transcriptional regulator with XRE-family HTH domain